MKYVALPVAGLVLIALLAWSWPASACGCGVLITSSDPDSGSWAYGEDSTEQSFINLEKGTEKMIISLDIRHTSRDAVLVIPIPADPTSVKADVLSETPTFGGYNVEAHAKQTLKAISELLLATQIYPVVPIVLFQSFGTGSTGEGFAGQDLTNAPTGSKSIGITVYQHLEKEGMIAEVLSASSSDSLYTYLNEKGLRVDKDSIPVFRDYIHNQFSFIVSWINPLMNEGNARGLLATFPADKMYYPLKPGSAYAGEGSSKTITIVGHVTPELYSDIKDSSTVNYFYSTEGLTFKDFFSSNSAFGFTKIVINATPQQLTQDLFISGITPVKILNAQLINLHPFIYGLLLLIIISSLSTYLVLRLFHRSVSPRPRLLGLTITSFLTIIGTIIGSRIFLKEKRFKYVVAQSLLFVALVLVVWFTLNSSYTHTDIGRINYPSEVME